MMPGRDEYMAWESGQMDRAKEAAFFQRLIDYRIIPTLNQRYQRRARELLTAAEVFE